MKWQKGSRQWKTKGYRVKGRGSKGEREIERKRKRNRKRYTNRGSRHENRKKRRGKWRRVEDSKTRGNVNWMSDAIIHKGVLTQLDKQRKREREKNNDRNV